MAFPNFQKRPSLPSRIALLAFSAALAPALSGCDAFWIMDSWVNEGSKPGVDKEKPCNTTTGVTSEGPSPETSSPSSNNQDTTSATPTEPAPCTEGDSRRESCGTCSSKYQECKDGEWVDTSECVYRKICEPGEIYIDRRNGRFDCGSTAIMARCDQHCLPTQELPTVLVSRCGPTDCCGSAPGARVACLSPDDLPEGGNCRTSPPRDAAIGKTWMTREMFDAYLERLKTQPPRCGDGIVEYNEECDDGNQDNNDDCNNACKRKPKCGDGKVNTPEEECDDANKDEKDGCSKDCKITPYCGNGIVDTSIGETCDDGPLNGTRNHNCSDLCQTVPAPKDTRLLRLWQKTAGDGCQECMDSNCAHHIDACQESETCITTAQCFAQERCTSRLFASLSCLCGNETHIKDCIDYAANESRDLSQFQGACAKPILQGIGSELVKDVFANFANPKIPTGNANRAFTCLSRYCHRQCKAFIHESTP